MFLGQVTRPPFDDPSVFTKPAYMYRVQEVEEHSEVSEEEPSMRIQHKLALHRDGDSPVHSSCSPFMVINFMQFIFREAFAKIEPLACGRVLSLCLWRACRRHPS